MRLRAALAALALVVPVALVASPAAGDDPRPTQLEFFNYNPLIDHAGQQSPMAVRVYSQPYGGGIPTGTVDVTIDGAAPITIPVDETGEASFTFTIPENQPFPMVAQFHGTNGWADSTRTITFTPLTQILFDPQPTLLKTGPSGAKLTLTFATYMRNSIGQGLPGIEIHFSMLGPVPVSYGAGNPLYVPVCTATTDATGLATCGGSAALSSIVSLLTGGGYATRYIGPFNGFDTAHLPVVLKG